MANDQAQIDYFPPNHLFAIYEKSLIDRYPFFSQCNKFLLAINITLDSVTGDRIRNIMDIDF